MGIFYDFSGSNWDNHWDNQYDQYENYIDLSGWILVIRPPEMLGILGYFPTSKKNHSSDIDNVLKMQLGIVVIP
jgi:hypothetical protein